MLSPAIWLKEGMDRSGWTGYKLAQETGYSEAFFSKVLKGQIQRPKREKIIKVGRLLAACWTQDLKQQNRYIDRGLLAADHAPLERDWVSSFLNGVELSESPSSVFDEMRNLIDRLERQYKNHEPPPPLPEGMT